MIISEGPQSWLSCFRTLTSEMRAKRSDNLTYKLQARSRSNNNVCETQLVDQYLRERNHLLKNQTSIGMQTLNSEFELYSPGAAQR